MPCLPAHETRIRPRAPLIRQRLLLMLGEVHFAERPTSDLIDAVLAHHPLRDRVLGRRLCHRFYEIDRVVAGDGLMLRRPRPGVAPSAVLLQASSHVGGFPDVKLPMLQFEDVDVLGRGLGPRGGGARRAGRMCGRFEHDVARLTPRVDGARPREWGTKVGTPVFRGSRAQKSPALFSKTSTTCPQPVVARDRTSERARARPRSVSEATMEKDAGEIPPARPPLARRARPGSPRPRALD